MRQYDTMCALKCVSYDLLPLALSRNRIITCFEIEVLNRVGRENVSDVFGCSGVSSDGDESVHVECTSVRRLVVRKILKTSPFSSCEIQTLQTSTLVVLMKWNLGIQFK